MAEVLTMDQPVRPDRGEEPDEERARRGQQRRHARRTTLLLVAIVLALYFGFIAYAVMSGLHGHH
jgi:hypothetical protein